MYPYVLFLSAERDLEPLDKGWPYVLFLSAEREKATKKRARCTLRVRTDYDSEKLCCGTRFAQTGPRTDSVTVFQSSYLCTCLFDLRRTRSRLTSSSSSSLGIAETSFTLRSLIRQFGIAHASMTLLSLNRNFPHRHGARCSIGIATNGHGSALIRSVIGYCLLVNVSKFFTLHLKRGRCSRTCLFRRSNNNCITVVYGIKLYS